jgi:proteasome accessory factor B
VGWWASASLPGSRAGHVRDDDWERLIIPYADEEALASLLLQFGPDAVVESPLSLREAVIRRLETIDV